MAINDLLRGLLGRVLKLPPRTSAVLCVEADLAVPMRDGVELMCNRIYSEAEPAGPVVLMRSPYGRGSGFGMMAKLIAERGFQVIIQSVRGTDGSGGQMNPMRQERDDGADTLAWVRQQPWFSGTLYAFGGSYLGNAVWALADAAPELLDGITVNVTLSNFRDEILGGGGFTQGGTLAWTQTEMMLASPDKKKKRPKPDSLTAAHQHLPVGEIDQVAFGKTVPWWQDWTAHNDPQDPWWDAKDFSSGVTALEAPVATIAGWRDIFLPYQIRDFEARQAAGKPTWLTIGPWAHISPGGMIESVRQAIDLFSALKRKQAPFGARAPVRLFLQGAKQWREYDTWPPRGAQPLQFHLGEGASLTAEQPRTAGNASYTFDPADPTPSLHGPQVMGGKKVQDMSELEQRSDTVSFTSGAFERTTDVIGPVSVNLAVHSDREHTDFFVALCIVDGKDRPLLVCDGYQRLRPAQPQADANGIRQISIDCWPTAYRFPKGSRLRLIVASGAHPRYARNPGTGEPMATATQLEAARQEIHWGSGFNASIQLLEAPEATSLK